MNMNIFNGIFGKIEPGMCRVSMNGDIAVKTSSGYKYYNLKTGRLVNCDSFAFDIGEDFFFVIPANKVTVGDIILVNRKPKCVKEIRKDSIVVINYEDNTVDTILPERHMLMGKQFFYGKIISMLGNGLLKSKKGGGLNNILKYTMMTEMLKGNGSGFGGSNTTGNNGLFTIIPLMMLSGLKPDGLFDGLFDFDMLSDFDEDDEDDENTLSAENDRKDDE